jgi:hypothetical protein
MIFKCSESTIYSIMGNRKVAVFEGDGGFIVIAVGFPYGDTRTLFFNEQAEIEISDVHSVGMGTYRVTWADTWTEAEEIAAEYAAIHFRNR